MYLLQNLASEKERLRTLYKQCSKGERLLNMTGVEQLTVLLGNAPLTEEEKNEISLQLDIKKNNGVTFDIFWNWWKS